jgi:hypothetical protein
VSQENINLALDNLQEKKEYFIDYTKEGLAEQELRG